MTTKASRPELGKARDMVGFGNGRMGLQGKMIKDPGELRRYYRENNGLRTLAVPQLRPNFMKPKYG